MDIFEFMKVLIGTFAAIFLFAGAFKILLEMEEDKTRRRKDERDD